MTVGQCFSEGWNLIEEDYLTLVGISLCGIILMYLLPLLLQGPVYCGMFLVLFDRMKGGRIKFERFFDGFNFFLPSLFVILLTFIPGIIVTVVVVVLAIGILASGAVLEDGGASGALLGSIGLLALILIIGLVVAISIQILLSFALPLVVDRRLGPIDACKSSMRTVRDNLGFVVGLVVLQSLLLFAGALLCGVGAVFAFPLVFASSAIAYRYMFGLDSTMNGSLI